MELKALSCYQFRPLNAQQVQATCQLLSIQADAHKIKGLVILGTEGINATLSGTEPDLRNFLSTLAPDFSWAEKELKWSPLEGHPFKLFDVKIRKEIVSLGTPDLVPLGPDHHLTPQQFHQALQDPDAVVVDTRNWYETRMGKFRRARDPHIREFRQFPEFIRTAQIPKDKKVLIYCTGGIRCEKAILEMRRQGYDKVYQLEGGILKYIEEFPSQEFEGDCFVFDHRIAVNQELKQAGHYEFCATCGQACTKGQACDHGQVQGQAAALIG